MRTFHIALGAVGALGAFIASVSFAGLVPEPVSQWIAIGDGALMAVTAYLNTVTKDGASS